MNDPPAPFIDGSDVFKALAGFPRLESLVTLAPQYRLVSARGARTDLALDFPMSRWQISETDFEDLQHYVRNPEEICPARSACT
jgi:hypothetical protein